MEFFLKTICKSSVYHFNCSVLDINPKTGVLLCEMLNMVGDPVIERAI